MEAINLNRLAYFAAVVDAGSFTRAAERLGITKTVVSQQVARLEAELKTTLLHRTTRRVVPTEAGLLLHARCAMILREAEDAVGEIAEANAAPAGVLRVAASNDYGACTIAPLAARFTQRFPDCMVDLDLSDVRLDPVERRIDLSIRVGWLDDSSLQARRLGSFRQLLVASPDMLAGRERIEPNELDDLPFVANRALREPLQWNFTHADVESQTVRMRPVMSTNSTPAVLAATIAGAGLSVLPDFVVEGALLSGTLVQVLPEWTLPSGGIYVVYPAARFRPPKVTAFVTMLANELQDRQKRSA